MTDYPGGERRNNMEFIELVQGLRLEMTATLQRVEGKVDLSLSQLGMVPSIARDVEQHAHAIYGNGTSGLNTRVSILERALVAESDALRAEVKAREELLASRHKERWAIGLMLLGLLGDRLKQLIFG